MDDVISEDYRERVGMIFRKACQVAGISSDEPWAVVGEHRRERHRVAGVEIVRLLVAAGIVFDEKPKRAGQTR